MIAAVQMIIGPLKMAMIAVNIFDVNSDDSIRTQFYDPSEIVEAGITREMLLSAMANDLSKDRAHKLSELSAKQNGYIVAMRVLDLADSTYLDSAQ